MANELKAMSVKELRKLKTNVDKALTDAEAREKREALKAAKRAAAEFGFSLDELSSEIKPKKRKSSKPAKKKAKSPPKYRNPENSDQTWSGRGRKPQWVHDAVAKGKDLADFAV